MSSVVDICNLALSQLGDNATVASIDPPEGSAQAEHCARWYPIARNTLLEMHTWSFATRRDALALLTDTVETWEYVYAMPNETISVIAVLDPDAPDDYSRNILDYSDVCNTDVSQAWGSYSPQPYTIETLPSGQRVILTNVEEAVVRYTTVVTDTTKFSPLFVQAMIPLLASYLAGPIFKGAEGAQMSDKMYQKFMVLLAQAKASDSEQRKVNLHHVVPWMSGR